MICFMRTWSNSKPFAGKIFSYRFINRFCTSSRSFWATSKEISINLERSVGISFVIPVAAKMKRRRQQTVDNIRQGYLVRFRDKMRLVNKARALSGSSEATFSNVL